MWLIGAGSMVSGESDQAPSVHYLQFPWTPQQGLHQEGLKPRRHGEGEANDGAPAGDKSKAKDETDSYTYTYETESDQGDEGQDEPEEEEPVPLHADTLEEYYKKRVFTGLHIHPSPCREDRSTDHLFTR